MLKTFLMVMTNLIEFDFPDFSFCSILLQYLLFAEVLFRNFGNTRRLSVFFNMYTPRSFKT